MAVGKFYKRDHLIRLKLKINKKIYYFSITYTSVGFFISVFEFSDTHQRTDARDTVASVISPSKLKSCRIPAMSRRVTYDKVDPFSYFGGASPKLVVILVQI